jgi:hypothetical protein
MVASSSRQTARAGEVQTRFTTDPVTLTLPTRHGHAIGGGNALRIEENASA